jgi:hypothetical protein
MTDVPYAGATPEQLRHPMVRELLGIHNVFRSQLQAMLEYVEELISGKEELAGPQTQVRIQALIRAGTQYTHMLHHHHQLETSMMFPALEQEGLEQTVVECLNSEHDAISILIDKFSASIRDLAAIEPEVMNNDMRRLAEALKAHLDYEETHVCPVLARWTRWPFMQ